MAVSEAARQTALHSGGGDFEVLFNGVDTERFETARTAPGRPSGRPTILFLGRHEPRKGLNVLLDAFATLERPAVLWVASDGPATEVQRRRYPASDRLHWLGVLSDDEVASRLAGAEVLCAPSLQGESFGMVLLEAHGGGLLGGRLGHRGLPHGGRRPRHPGAPGDAGALSRALGVALADAVEGSGPSSTEARKAARSAGTGRWTRWPSATSTSTRRAVEAFRAVDPRPLITS